MENSNIPAEDVMNTAMPHNDEVIAMHQEGDHTHHTKNFKPHAAGHKLAADHVKSMCGGGMAKGKK
jgi:hypothetical protein